MKKIFDKKTILTIIISGFIFSFISVFAYSIMASDVTFKSNKTNFTSTNVHNALNTLYDRSTNIADRIDGTFHRDAWSGYAQPKTFTLNLTKGNYYVITTFGQSYSGTFVDNSDVDLSNFTTLSFTYNGLTCTNVQNNCIKGSPTSNVSGSSSKHELIVCDIVKKCNVPESGSVSFLISPATTTPSTANSVAMNSIKID